MSSAAEGQCRHGKVSAGDVVIKQTDVGAPGRSVRCVFHFRRNLCVTQFDSVFIYGLPYGPRAGPLLQPPTALSAHR